ncbi:MAG: hypothetical protein LBT47_01690 [Deltaproteobacteria bacterium]|jgi:hypothetical protein|nr:hypothetical protein [Deltaproteobacteria bacterium]
MSTVSLNDAPSTVNKKKATILLVFILLFIAGAVYLTFNYFENKGAQEADRVFSLVMNKAFGVNNWERTDINYSLFTRTMTAEKVTAKINNNTALTISVDRMEVKGGLNYDETEKLLALGNWIDQPKTELASRLKLFGLTIKGDDVNDFEGNVTVKEISFEDLAFNQAPKDNIPGMEGFYLALSWSKFYSDSLKLTVGPEKSSPSERLDLSLARLTADQFSFRPPNPNFKNQTLQLLDRIKFGLYQIEDLKFEFLDNQELITFELATQRFENVEGLKFGQILYRGLKFYVNVKKDIKIDGSLDDLSIVGLDLGPLAARLQEGFELDTGYDSTLDKFSEMQTIADLFIPIYSLKSTKLTGFKLNLNDYGLLTLDNLDLTGELIAGEISPKVHSSLTASYTPPKLSSTKSSDADFLKFVEILERLELSTLTANIDATCDYVAEGGKYSCQFRPTFGLTELFDLNAEFTFTGLTDQLIKQMAKTRLSEIEALFYSPEFSKLLLTDFRFEVVNQKLLDKLYGFYLSENSDATRQSMLQEISNFIDFSSLFLDITQLSQLQADLKTFSAKPKKIVLHIKPSIALVDLSNYYLDDYLDLITQLNLTVQVNDLAPIPIIFNSEQSSDLLPDSSSEDSKEDSSSIPSGPVLDLPLEDDPKDEDGQNYEDDENNQTTQTDQSTETTKYTIDELNNIFDNAAQCFYSLMNFTFGEGNWETGETYIDDQTLYFVAENISIDLESNSGYTFTKPLTIDRLSLGGVPNSDQFESVLYSQDWVNKDGTEIAEVLTLEGITWSSLEDLDFDGGTLTVSEIALTELSMDESKSKSTPDLLGFFTHLNIGSFAITGAYLDATVSLEDEQAVQITLDYLSFVNPNLGKVGSTVPAPWEDPLNFFRAIYVENLFLDGLKIAVLEPRGFGKFNLGYLTLAYWDELKLTGYSLNDVDFSFERKFSPKHFNQISLGSFTIQELDFNPIFKKIEPEYNVLVRDGFNSNRDFETMFELLIETQMLTSLFSSAVSYDSFNISDFSFNYDGLIVDVDNFSAIGPFAADTLPTSQKYRYSGKIELPTRLTGLDFDSLYFVSRRFNQKSFPFSGGVDITYDAAKETLTYQANPFLAFDGQFSLGSEFTVVSLTEEVLNALGFIKLEEIERAALLPGLDRVGLSQAKFSFEDKSKNFTKNLMLLLANQDSSTGETTDSSLAELRQNMGDSFAEVLTEILGYRSESTRVLTSDLERFLLKPEKLTLDVRPSQPFRFATILGLINDETNHYNIINDLGLSMSFNQQSPVLLRARQPRDAQP